MWQVPLEIYLSYHVSQDCRIISTYLTLPRKHDVTNILAEFHNNRRQTDRQTDRQAKDVKRTFLRHK